MSKILMTLMGSSMKNGTADVVISVVSNKGDTNVEYFALRRVLKARAKINRESIARTSGGALEDYRDIMLFPYCTLSRSGQRFF